MKRVILIIIAVFVYLSVVTLVCLIGFSAILQFALQTLGESNQLMVIGNTMVIMLAGCGWVISSMVLPSISAEYVIKLIGKHKMEHSDKV